jgi:hypothetical protein
MNKAKVLGIGIFLTAILVGCGKKDEAPAKGDDGKKKQQESSASTPEDKLMEANLDAMQKLVKLMEAGKEDAAAKAEAEKLNATLKEIKTKVDALPKEKQMELMTRWLPKMTEVTEKFGKLMIEAMKKGLGDGKIDIKK